MGVRDKAPEPSLTDRFLLVYKTDSDNHKTRFTELQKLLAEVDGLPVEDTGLGCALLFKSALKQLVHASLTVPFDVDGGRAARRPTCVVSVQPATCCGAHSIVLKRHGSVAGCF